MKPLTLISDKDGYARAYIRVNKKPKNLYSHRSVCEAWHGAKPTPKHEIRHLDGNCCNNTPDNLKWGTRKENAQDMMRQGRGPKGDRCGRSKLSVAQALELVRRAKAGERNRDLAKEYGLSRTHVTRLTTGKGRPYLTDLSQLHPLYITGNIS